MRPDQHKKKKNAEYKKKHGIQSKGKNKDTSKSVQPDGSKSAPKYENAGKPDDDDEGPLNTQETVESESQQSFSRRQIESNWDRYKEDEDLDTDFNPLPNKIGTDFQTLLDKKGGPSSRFHFQSEKEWGNISKSEEVEVEANPLSIDFRSLAQALRSIPLGERFEIDKKYFEDDHLENTNTTGDHSTSTLSMNAYLETQLKTEKLKQTVSPNFSKPNKPSQKSNKPDSIEQQKVHEGIKLQNMVSDSAVVDVNEKDDFLDSLLGIETKELRKTDIKVNPDQDNRSKNGTNVLVTNDTSKADTVPEVTKPPQETKEDLEDWLDSILD